MRLRRLQAEHGVVSRAGISPLSWLLDHAGPIASTVLDAAVFLDAISGYDTAPGAGGVTEVATRLEAGVAGLRVGVPARQPGPRWNPASPPSPWTRCTTSKHSACTSSTSSCRRWTTSPVFAIMSAECRVAHRSIWPERRDEFGPDLQNLLSMPALDGDTTVSTLRGVAAYRQEVRRVLTEVDLLASPTIPAVAPPIGADTVSLGGVDVAVVMALIANTMPYNMAHLPAVSLPCGLADGLPVGLQFAGAPFVALDLAQDPGEDEKSWTAGTHPMGHLVSGSGGPLPVIDLVGTSMSGLVQAIPVIAARSGREVIVIGGLAVVCRLNRPYRATSDLDTVNRRSSVERAQLGLLVADCWRSPPAIGHAVDLHSLRYAGTGGAEALPR